MSEGVCFGTTRWYWTILLRFQGNFGHTHNTHTPSSLKLCCHMVHFVSHHLLGSSFPAPHTCTSSSTGTSIYRSTHSLQSLTQNRLFYFHPNGYARQSQRMCTSIPTDVHVHPNRCARPSQPMCTSIPTDVHVHPNGCARPSQPMCTSIPTGVHVPPKDVRAHACLAERMCPSILTDVSQPKACARAAQQLYASGCASPTQRWMCASSPTAVSQRMCTSIATVRVQHKGCARPAQRLCPNECARPTQRMCTSIPADVLFQPNGCACPTQWMCSSIPTAVFDPSIPTAESQQMCTAIPTVRVLLMSSFTPVVRARS
jgi:hypothetical protein